MSNHQFNQHAGIYKHSRVRDHVSIHIEKMLRSVPPTPRKHSIFRVHHQLREVNDKAYEPVILAIGPYHYGNDKFKFMEEQKLRYLQQLLNRLKRRNKGSVDRYVLALWKLKQRARNCYAEAIDLSQEDFLAMMLIDGCFIVELFRKYNNMIPTDEDDPVMHQLRIRHSIRRDLLLLENQLPLFILNKLYDLTRGPDEHPEFIYVASTYLLDPSQERTIDKESEHLLHLYHTWWTSGLPEKARLNYRQLRPFISSVTELREAGVRFRAARGEELSDIKFENGTLEIPVLKVEDNTESKFRNLMAYEQHRQGSDINYFTNYMSFMDCLINSSKDVKVLRRARIIKNYLGDDEVVAQMFNKMCDNVVSSSSYYSDIFQDMNAHCRKRRNVWMAKLRREYFHSPWAFLSVLAAIVLLLLTAAQTVFTVLS